VSSHAPGLSGTPARGQVSEKGIGERVFGRGHIARARRQKRDQPAVGIACRLLNWLNEIKFDGYRALDCVASVTLESCRGTETIWGGKFAAVRDSIPVLTVQDAVLDGEIVAFHEGIEELLAWSYGLSDKSASSPGTK
jgi:ATP-dependent DNA ligase